tara:strand:+ start:380 stop:1273 length:894 start_codon:yes stop_codon:yes gene_type:complete
MEKRITILSTSYISGEHLNRLFKNLIEKAQNKDALQFLIIDNTNGEDSKLINLFSKDIDIKIIVNDGRNLQRSISHASALDIGLKESKTEYTLIIDPDVHVFKNGWDNFCLDYYEKEERLVIGAPYPEWKLGKVHDYPSVVFFFFRTQEIKNLNKSFYPFPSLVIKLKNSILRKVNRLGFIGSRERLDKSHFLQKLTITLESLFGTTSPDTGKDIINSLREKSYKSINFKAFHSNLLKPPKASLSQYRLSKEFELYFYNKDPFMTHMYGSGVFHWKTVKGSNVNFWIDLINNVESEL